MNPLIICFCDSFSISKLQFLRDRMGRMIGETRAIAAEYREAYPDEKEQYQRVRLEETSYKSEKMDQFAEFCGIYKYFAHDHLFTYGCLHKRWGTVYMTEPIRFMRFLASPRKMGDIFRRKAFPPFQTEFYQTMKNISTFDHLYEYGKNFVGIGYVDLSPLLWGTYCKEDCRKPMHYYGYEASLVVALRSKIIYEMLKMDQKEIATESILQVTLLFFSCNKIEQLLLQSDICEIFTW